MNFARDDLVDALLELLLYEEEGVSLQQRAFNYTYPCCISHASAQFVYPKFITYA